MRLSKDKIKSWLKNKHNFAFLSLILFAIVFRGYYFLITLNQSLWWDEAGYMAGAKSYAGIGAYELESIRSSGFSRTMSLFYMLGIESESVIRFFGLYVPSIILIVLTFILLSKMYENKKVALIGTTIMVFLWENLFYSNRFHTENLALIFQYISLIALFYLYGPNKNNSSKRLIGLIAITSALAVWYRPGNIFFIPALIFFVFIMEIPFFTKTKARKITAIIGLFLIAVGFFLLLNLFADNTLVSNYYHPDEPLSWKSFEVFLGFFKSQSSWIPSVFFYAFIIGLFSAFLGTYLYLPEITKNTKNLNQDIKSNMFNLLLLFFVMFGFFALIRPTAFEYRWFFPFLPALLGFSANGILIFSDWISKMTNNKNISIFLIILLTIFGAYTQFSIVDPLVKQKVPSYLQVKEAGIWLNKNAAPTDLVLSTSVPRISYYSERKTITYTGMSMEEFEIFLSEVNPKYFMISIFEGNPSWLQDWLNSNGDRLVPVQVYTMDNQPVAIIYSIN